MPLPVASHEKESLKEFMGQLNGLFSVLSSKMGKAKIPRE